MNVNDLIIDAWNSYLLSSRQESTTAIKDRKFYASDMGKCLRMRFLKRKGISGEYGVDTYYTFAHGDFIHKLGYKALEAKGILVATEQRLEDEHFVCKYDGKIRTEDGKNTLFDFKSTNPYVMKRLVDGGSDNIENVMQVLMAKHLDKEDTNLTDSGVLVYVNKLPSEKGGMSGRVIYTREYHYKTYKEDLEEDIDRLVNMWLKDIIPPCTCPSWASQQYNSFWMFCKMGEKDIRKYLAMIESGKRVTSDGFKITMTEPQIKGVIDNG